MGKEFLREEMIFGSAALKHLSQCHVAVFGIGGVGSYSAEALARAGVGKLTLIDNDTVSESNINRQLCALRSTIGQYKADVMAHRVQDINPGCQVQAITRSYTHQDRDLFPFSDYDYIIDAIDTVSCKLSLIETAQGQQVPIISSMGTGNMLDPTKFCITDISKTIGCPLARVVRKELRNRGILHHQVLYSQELPLTPLPLEAPPEGRRSVPASVSWVPSCAGLMLAGFVVRQLIDKMEQ